MRVDGANVVITGAGSGIGRAMALRFAEEGAETIVVADRDSVSAADVAKEVGGLALTVDVSLEEDNTRLIEHSLAHMGHIDLLCLNAGVVRGGGIETPTVAWWETWTTNVMAHVWALQIALPEMLARGSGYVLHTASAAGLLTNVATVSYSVSKHAVVSLAEWLAINHGGDGIGFSCLCPQGVRTAMLFDDPGDIGGDVVREQGVLEPEDVAEAVVDGLAQERFLILPHPEVETYLRRKVEDPDRWIRGMRRLAGKASNA